MLDTYTETAGRVLIEVIERSATLFADPLAIDKVEPVDEPLAVARIEFSGHGEGVCELTAAVSTAKMIAESVLGCEVNDEEVADALQELLNVFTGNFLTEVAGRRRVFDLSKPESRLGVSPDKWLEKRNSPGAAAASAEGAPILVRVAVGRLDPV